MIQKMSAKDARNNFSRILGQVYYGRDIIIIEKQKKPMVAIIPVDQLETHMKMRSEKFKALENIRETIPDISQEEVEKDVSDAIAAIREQDD